MVKETGGFTAAIYVFYTIAISPIYVFSEARIRLKYSLYLESSVTTFDNASTLSLAKAQVLDRIIESK